MKLSSDRKFSIELRNGITGRAVLLALVCGLLSPSCVLALTLTWQDDSNNEDGFKVERSTDAANFAQIAQLPANTTSYSDAGLASCTTYYYRVRAYNSAGDSAYSDPASGSVPCSTVFGVTVTASPSAGGTVSGGGTVASGTTTTVTATPNSCYSFVNWTEAGAVVSTSASYSFTVTGNRNLVANFAPISYTITTVVTPSSGGTTSGGGSANCGSSVTVTATPNAGYGFVSWTESGAVVSTSASYTFTATSNRSLVANFATVTYTVAVSATPTSSGSVSGGGNYASGASATVIATANSCYNFVSWTAGGTVVSTSPSYTFTVTGNRALVANFAPISYTITTGVTPSSGGTASGGGSANCGSSVTVTATPNAGYGFVSWTENGAVVSTSASYTFTATSNRSLVANFATVTYTVAVSATPTSSGSVSGGGNYTSGASATVIATANSCYNFVSWTAGGTVVGTSPSYTFTVTGNRALVANFAPISYTITTGVAPSSGGTASGGGSVNCGSSVTVTATPNAGYGFVSWTESGAVVSTSPSYTFTATSSRSLVANFTPVSSPPGPASNPTIPSNFTTVGVWKQVNLSWTSSNDATGYKIERAGSPAGPWSQIADVGSTVTSYRDTGLWDNETYYYRIRAYNATAMSDFSAVTVATTRPDLNLLGHWGFEEDGGSTVSDLSGKANAGAVYNAAWIEGISGSALDFNGVNAQVVVNNSAALNPTTALTIAAWIAPNSWSGYPRILQKGSNSDQYRLLARNRSLRFSLAGINLDMPAPAPGSWYHVAGTYDGSSMKLYLDGQLVAQRVVRVALVAGTEPLCIGNRPGSTSKFQYFDGAIDDVRIYGRALTADEIRNLANAFDAVTVLFPNGGQTIKAGLTYSVVWGAPTNAVSFRLNYSVDGGSSWSAIANKVTSDSFTWRVPVPAATITRGLIQVIGYDASGANVGTDTSDSYFTIQR